MHPRGFHISTRHIFDSSSWSEPVYHDALGYDQDVSSLYNIADRIQLFIDADDRVYLSYTAFIRDPVVVDLPFGMSPFVCEIDLQTGKLLSRPRRLRDSTFAPCIAEGSHIFAKDNYYYLITAEGGTEEQHQEWICRSRHSPYGPWELPPLGVNPIVYNGLDKHVQHTGHMDMVETPDGQWVAVLLAVRPQYDTSGPVPSQLGRETFLVPVRWEDGWPVINNRCPISITAGDDRSSLALGEKVNRFYSFVPGQGS